MEDFPKEFKNSLSCLAAGVSVVTYNHAGKIGGLTVTSFTSVSMDPPLVLVCVKKTAASHEDIIRTGSFAVNMLSSAQEGLSGSFAGSADRNEAVTANGSKNRVTGSPVLDGCIANLDCTVENICDGGDHSIIIGRVVHAESNPDLKPLLYFQRGYRLLA